MTGDTFTVALGSLNPVKLAATGAAVERVFPKSTVFSVDIQSSGPAQPIGDDATAAGALERAGEARQAGDADYGIGLEGGIRQLPGGGWGVCTCAAVVERGGRTALGGGPIVGLPPSVVEQVLAGEELGSVMDCLVGATDDDVDCQPRQAALVRVQIRRILGSATERHPHAYGASA